MVVQHNMAAMNASLQSGKTQLNMGKSAEKLGSGYRINRAADNAAGLSISEKMREQIRGLDRGSQNLQDGVSVAQLADGALNETHALLQRIRELAVQAANDVNTGEDRQAIQSEINQLAEEVDDIAHHTSFNDGIYPLLGSAPVTGFTPDPGYASVLDKYVMVTDPAGGLGSGGKGATGGIGMYIKGMTDYAGAIGGYGNNGHAMVQLTLNDGTKTAPISLFSSTSASGSVSISQIYDQDHIEMEYEDSSNGVHFKVNIACKMVEENDPATMKGGQYFLSSFDITNLGVPVKSMDVLLHTDPIHGFMSGSPSYNNTSLGSKSFSEIVDPTKDYSFVCNPAAYPGVKCDVTAKMTSSLIKDPPDVVYAGSGFNQYNPQTNMDILQDIYNGTMTPAYASDYHFGAGWVNRPLDTGATFNASTMFGLSYPISKASADPTKSPDGIWIQCSSKENDALRLSFVDATAATLKIKKPYPDVTTHQAASAAITTLDQAIETVNSYRTNFGVGQNTMESLRRNADSMSENTQAAESRVRDTDMAEEMVRYSKYQILSQITDAMLVQANQTPQSVLQLLS